MTGTMRVPRSRGMLSGVLLVALGLWGGLIPFLGPYAGFGFTPDEAWHFDSDRFLLNVAPAVATVVGGLLALASANRAMGMIGAWLAALGGAWFIVGGTVSTLWTDTGAAATGQPLGGQTQQAVEQLTMHTGLGAVIVFLAAMALGRFAVVGVKEAQRAQAEHEARLAQERRLSGEPSDARPAGTAEPETRRPDARQPETGAPDAAEPDSRRSDTTQPIPTGQGRYSRPGEPPQQVPTQPGAPPEHSDQRVAGRPPGGGETGR